MRYQRTIASIITIAVISVIFYIASQLRLILVPFVVAYIFQFALRPFVNMLKQQNVGHKTAVSTVFCTAFFLVFTLMYFLIPAIVSEFATIQSNFQEYTVVLINKYNALKEIIDGSTGSFSELIGERNIADDFSSSFQENIRFFFLKIPQKILGILPMFMYVVIIPFATFFFLLDSQRIKERLVSLIPNRYFEISLNIINSLHKQFGLILEGMLASAIIISILASVLLWLIGLQYPILVGIFSGIANLIPYFGPLAGTVSATLVALVTGAKPIYFIYIILVFLFINIIDNVLVQPLVLARAAKLHPLAVIFLVMTGSKFGGVFGMLLAVPVASLLQVVFHILYREIKKPPRPPFKDFIDRDTLPEPAEAS